FYDTGNGDLGNQGIHQMDIARWMLGVKELSPRVMSVGGRLCYDDDGETPNTQVVFHDYDPAPLVFEVRGLPKDKESQADKKTWEKGMDSPEGFGGKGGIGVIVYCEGGYVAVVGGGDPVVAFDKDGKEVKKFAADRGRTGHMQNFTDAVRSRKREDLSAHSLDAPLSTA